MPGQKQLSPGLWRLLALLMLSVIINYIDRGSLSAAAPLLQDELGLSPSQIGVLLSAFFCTYAAFMIAAGWFADHLNVNWVLAIGFFVWCVATGATGLVHGFWALFVARFVLGMGESVSFPCYSTLIARHFSEQRRGIANAVLATGLGIGPALGMFTSGTLMAKFGWRPVFIGLGLFGLLWLPAWIKWMPRELHSAAPKREQPAPGILEILKQRSAWGTCISYPTQTYLWYLLLTWTPYYLVRARHFSMADMAKIAGAAYLCTAVSAPVSGWLSDHWIEAGGSATLVRKTFTVVGLTCAGISLLFCSLVGPATSVACLLLAYAFYGSFIAHPLAIIQTQAGPQASGTWFAMANFFGSLAGIVAPAVTGYLVNRTGSFVWPFAITGFIAVLGSLCWLFVVGPVVPVVWAEKLGLPKEPATVGSAR